jgi:probable F420-dependent oxidoreductase
MAKVDQFLPGPLEDIGEQVAEAEARRVDGLWIGELKEDPFLCAVRAIEHSSQVTVGTSIAVALARSPMNTAYLGYGLNRFARGRFILGLGSQVKSQIEDRFSMVYTKPNARMAEYVAALRAIWWAWQNGEQLKFAGDFYQHTSMEPTFTPGPSPYGSPKIYLAAVNPRMLRTAAQIADGIILMLTPPRYLREVILPIVEEGLKASGRQRKDIEICVTMGSYTGAIAVDDEADLKAAMDKRRAEAPYYLSVPNYRSMLEIYGYGDLQPALHEVRYSDLPQAEKWARMASMIPDDLLLHLGTYGPAAELPGLLKEKFGTDVDRFLMFADGFYEPDCTPTTLRAALS